MSEFFVRIDSDQPACADILPILRVAASANFLVSIFTEIVYRHFVTVTPVAINFTVAANAVADAHSIANVASMLLAAPDACQAETFTIPLTLTGSQS